MKKIITISLLMISTIVFAQSTYKHNTNTVVKFEQASLNKTKDTIIFKVDRDIRCVQIIDNSQPFIYKLMPKYKRTIKVPIWSLPNDDYYVILTTKDGHGVMSDLTKK